MKEEIVFYEKQYVLTTYINEDGVYIRFFPFILKYKFFSWDTILKAYIREYHPILEYGGWGIKHGRFRFNPFRIRKFGMRRFIRKYNIAYIISGNIGLQLELTDGKRILIGTRKSVELEDVLRKSGKWKE